MKTIVIFGGSSGIGKQLFAGDFFEGFEVNFFGSAQCDVSKMDQVDDVMMNYQPDAILNLAAVNIDAIISRSKDSKDVEKQLRVNALGAFNIINSACAHWELAEKKGKIVLMSSFLSTRPVKGAGIYSASKAFIDSLVKTAAIENAKHGITCNSIQAGFFDAGLTDKLPQNIKDALPKRIPLGRLGQVSELANAIKFLLSNDYVTGTNLVIDGGVSLV